MSIKFKIFSGCVLLTLLTLILGGLAHRSEREIGELATQIYDRAFMSMSYLRSAQNTLSTLRESASQKEDLEQQRSDIEAMILAIEDDLAVATERAMSDEGRAATQRLSGSLQALTTSRGEELQAGLNAIQDNFDTAVEIFAGDGFRYRKAVGAIVDRALQMSVFATALSLLMAIATTIFLARSIIPSLTQAVDVAEAIAGGKLDNEIVPRGGGETFKLQVALSRMQASIARNLAQIRNLLDEQASTHASEMYLQNARFDAALQNMTQGLCLFDANERLCIYNDRFEKLFGKPAAGRTEADLLQDIGAHQIGATGHLTMLTMGDGRIISMSREAISAGGSVCTFEDVTERRKLEERLSFLAQHDALTKLPNRVMLQGHTENLMASDLRPAVMCLDLDGFKSVNDTLGHPVGDKLLCAVADRLRALVQPSDLLVRLGGDEFAIIRIDGKSGEALSDSAQSIIDALSSPFVVEKHQVVIGTSIGIAQTECDWQDPDEPLKRADMALYRAKAEGRGIFRFFEPEMDARLRERRLLEIDLRAALVKGEFELFYQPLVATSDGETVGFEALLRWRHPERGLVFPGDFIPLAEEIGLIDDMGAWALHTACSQAMQWPSHIKIAVNLSPIQFRNRSLPLVIASALARSGLVASRLEVEITESVLLVDSDAVLEILNEIKTLGVSIAMDDFGTGYSSLSYLRRFPFDKIKIDQSFTKNVFEEDGLAIVRAVLALGQSLRMRVIAEGVETIEQLEALRGEGCCEVQGYLFSRPKPAAELGPLLGATAERNAISVVSNAAA